MSSLESIVEANKIEMGEERAAQVHALAILITHAAVKKCSELIGPISQLAFGLGIDESEVRELIAAGFADEGIRL